MSTGIAATPDLRYVRRLLLYVLLSVVFSLLCFFSLALGSRRYRREYQIDERRFRDAVYFAISDLTFRVVAPIADSRVESPTTNIFPVVFFLDGWQYWEDVYGDRWCAFDGGRYRVGDYGQYGLCVQISEHACFFRGPDNSFVLVKPRYSASPKDAGPLQRGGVSGEEELDTDKTL